MAHKTFSFIVPLSISFFLVTTVGLTGMYFGIYRPAFHKYANVISHGKSQGKITSTKSADSGKEKSDDTLGSREKSSEAPKTRSGTSGKIAATKGKNRKKGLTKPTRRKSSAPKTHAASKSPIQRKAKQHVSKKRNGGKSNEHRSAHTRNRETDEENSESVAREPAFKRSQRDFNEADNEADFESSADETEENPLMRALRNAKRRKENHDANPDGSEKHKQKNPFDFLFNKNNESEE